MIRALYEWILDNRSTPYLLVDASVDNVVVPTEYVENGKIVLNISPGAIQGLKLGNDEILFSARFAGQARNITFPVSAVLAIYARENGRGMMFDEQDDSTPPNGDDTPPGGTSKKPTLKVIK